MDIAEDEKIDKVVDIDFNDIFYLPCNTTYFHALDVCLILNGVVDVMVFRKADIKNLSFSLEKVKLVIEETKKYV